MAMDLVAAEAAVKADIKTAMAVAYGQPEATYDEFAGILAGSVTLLLQHVLDNAETSVDAEAIL